MSTHKEMGGRFLTFPVMILIVLMVIGGYFIADRFINGIGAVTNLNDGYTWGIWVVIDVVVGTAFGCGGFAMALLVYIFNKGEYHPLMRPALLGGLFGYTLAGAAVMLDLGRWWQAYNILLPWYMHPDSVMLEVALCVAAYVTVLWIEFSPAFMEKFGLEGPKRFLKKYMFVFIALGITLPFMHQSSLGSMVVVLESQMSPLYHTIWLPLLFVSSAIMMGYAVTMFEATVITKRFRLPSEVDILAKVGHVVMYIVAGWLALRFATIFSNGAFGEAFKGDAVSVMFWIEITCTVGGLVALITARHSERGNFIGACLLLLSGTLYRINTYLVAYEPMGNWNYFPSVPELMVTVGIVAFEIFLYLLFVKKLPVLHHHGYHA